MSTYLTKRNSELQDEVAMLRRLLQGQQVIFEDLCTALKIEPALFDVHRDVANYLLNKGNKS